MKSINIRQVDEKVLEALKRRAKRHRRSLQKEVESIMVDAAQMTLSDTVETANPLSALRMVASGQPEMTWSRESYYDEDGR